MKNLLLKTAFAALITTGALISEKAHAFDASLTLRAEVPVSCTGDIDGTANKVVSNLSFTTASSVTVPMNFNCNVPFSGTVRADNGGFKNSAAVTAGYKGGTSEVEYTLTMDGDSGKAGPFASNALLSGQTFGGGKDILFSGAKTNIQVAWTGAGTNAKLYGGTYQDIVRFTVTPTP